MGFYNKMVTPSHMVVLTYLSVPGPAVENTVRVQGRVSKGRRTRVYVFLCLERGYGSTNRKWGDLEFGVGHYEEPGRED